MGSEQKPRRALLDSLTDRALCVLHRARHSLLDMEMRRDILWARYPRHLLELCVIDPLEVFEDRRNGKATARALARLDELIAEAEQREKARRDGGARG